MQSHVEKLFNDEIAKCKDNALACASGDSLKHAQIKGRAQAFEDAKAIVRKAMRIDVEEEAA